jgi:hypothetical protein
MNAGLYGLHRINLVMYGRGRAGQVENGVHFHHEREGHVVAHQFKIRIIEKLKYVIAPAGKKVIHAYDFIAPLEQTFDQMPA